ncbi:MAG: PaaI family thioesterase [Pseudomonadota bacterium]
MDEVTTRIRASLAKQTLMTTFGAELVSAGPGRCVMRAPITDAVRQQHGFAHAGLTFALGDSAAGYAALSLLPQDQEVVTVEMKINLMAPALGDSLLATGTVVRAGKQLTVVTSEVEAIAADGARKSVALLQGTMAYVTP